MARKILLADDSVTAQNMGRKILADAGYEVITVNNGSAALKKITETKPDLIVLDVYMPGYSGLEVCQRLKEVQETSRIPVLLTVGKLEPFKPEEAKRVRAEGYIVKPFEASELLSALAKLEDKIVPRGEASKPGRFARANAALDEGRYDKSVAIEEDSGWKNRISFPTKKKSKAEDAEDAKEAAVTSPAAAPVVSAPVISAPVVSAPVVAAASTVDSAVVEPYQASKANDDSRVNLGALAPEGLPKDVTPEEIAALAAAAARVKGKIADVTGAEPEVPSAVPAAVQPESKTENQPVAELPPVAQPAEAAAEPVVPAPSPAEVGAAIASLEPAAEVGAHANSGNGAAPHAAAEKPAEEPVTMAAAAGAGSTYGSSRWMAVPVALAGEETGISLEQEMQKAYAAFAEAQTAHADFVASIPEIHSAPAEPADRPVQPETASPVEAAAEAVASAPEAAAPEVSQAMSAVASAATDAISAAVKELEAVAASYTELQPQAPSQSEPAAMEAAAPATLSSSEVPPAIEAKTAEEELSSPASSKPEESKIEAPTFQQAETETKVEAQKQDEPEAVRQEEPKREESKPEDLQTVASAETSETHVSEHQAHEVQAEEAKPAAEAGKKDSDIAATTAAAWANWRRVRESSPQGADAPQDAAARAVAAGAEKTPDGANQDSGDIADIVDSVLADLRPKIVEEISRKMKKK